MTAQSSFPVAPPADYPGTPQHQALLRALVAHYEHDPRVLAVIVFGSLVRGNWDALSDLDLDVVVVDSVELDVSAELRRLTDSFRALGEETALIIPYGEDEGDVVLASLGQLSIRYHSLSATSPAIVDSMRVLFGRIEPQAIASAGLANHRPDRSSDSQLDIFVRYAVVADVYLQRGQLWRAVEVVHRMRNLLLAFFARARDRRPDGQPFEELAGPALAARLAVTLPVLSLDSLVACLWLLIDMLECDLDELTDSQVVLSERHRLVLERVRQRLAPLRCG